MSETIYLLSICLPLATVLLVFGMKYFAAVQAARARRDSDEAYRRLADEAARTQREAAQALAAIQATLADVNGRLAQLERILKEVE